MTNARTPLHKRLRRSELKRRESALSILLSALRLCDSKTLLAKTRAALAQRA